MLIWEVPLIIDLRQSLRFAISRQRLETNEGLLKNKGLKPLVLHTMCESWLEPLRLWGRASTTRLVKEQVLRAVILVDAVNLGFSAVSFDAARKAKGIHPILTLAHLLR